MAYSSTPEDIKTSVGYTQDDVKVQCDLCDSRKDHLWHCTNCVKTMCLTCLRIHNKLHKDHKIITEFEWMIVQHLNTKCQPHDLIFLYYCENCQINICYKCRRTAHAQCNLIDIDKHAEMLKPPLMKRVNQQRKHLPEINKISDSIKDHLTNIDDSMEKQKSLIEALTEKIHKDIDSQRSHLIWKLKCKQVSTHETLNGQKQNLQDLKTLIENITTSIKTQINLVPDAGVLQLVNDGNKKLNFTSIKMFIKLPNNYIFSPSTLWEQGNNPLGSLQIVDRPKATFTIDTHIEPSPLLRNELSVTRVMLSLDIFEFIVSCTSDDNTCWIGLSTNAVKITNQHGDQLLRVQLSHDTKYTALTTKGELLVSGGGTKIISRVNKSGDVHKFTDISGVGVKYVNGLVTTRQDDVFVCVRMTHITKDKVITFSAHGKKISKLNSHFFTSTKLFGIHAVSRDTFCVQDGDCKGGRLVFVDGGGQMIRHIDRTTTELKRNITNLTGDRHGNLIIASVDSEYIHVLSGEGTCKCTYHLQGSEWIEGVSVGEDDVLWVGSTALRGWVGALIVAKYLD